MTILTFKYQLGDCIPCTQKTIHASQDEANVELEKLRKLKNLIEISYNMEDVIDFHISGFRLLV